MTPPRLLLFGDRVTDHYLLPLARRGGYADPSADDQDWMNHDQWLPLRCRGGVEMAAEMLRLQLEWAGLPHEIDTWPDPARGKPPLRSLARLGKCKLDKESGLPRAFEAVQASQAGALDLSDPKQRFRVERFEGYRGPPHPAEPSGNAPPPDLSAADAPEMIGIVDAGTELRGMANDPNSPFVRKMRSLSGGDVDVVMKMHLPLAKGEPWEAFKQATGARHRFLIVGAGDLRMHRGEDAASRSAPIARCPSWDRIAEDLRAALTAGTGLLPQLVAGSDALIVLFDVEGAAVVTGPATAPEIALVFDPMRAEGEVARRLPGDMIGKMSRFQAALIVELLKTPGKDLVDRAREATLAAMLTARLHAESWLTLDRTDKGWTLRHPPTKDLHAAHKKRLEDARPGSGLPTYRLVVPGPSTPGRATSLLTDAAPGEGKTEEARLAELARKIVLDGVEQSLEGLPHGRFGKLWTVDRDEIEGLRALDRLIGGYLAGDRRTRPLSVAVFGPPGAGKSFGVKQLVDPAETPVLEFNLSQADESEMAGFFHEIRDSNLRGKVPLVFFDEFDSHDLALLKLFLAPMQDGVFLENKSLRPIGPAVFVFAGGTSPSFDAFQADIAWKEPETPPRGKDEKEREHQRRAAFEAREALAKRLKKPDFISRLRGRYDVKGPNPAATGSDKTFVLRRAILLRRKIEEFLPGVISVLDKRASIEPELLEALLHVETYRHGARSMELLIRALAAGEPRSSVGRSDLPIDQQIEMLVDLASWRRLAGG